MAGGFGDMCRRYLPDLLYGKSFNYPGLSDYFMDRYPMDDATPERTCPALPPRAAGIHLDTHRHEHVGVDTHRPSTHCRRFCDKLGSWLSFGIRARRSGGERSRHGSASINDYAPLRSAGLRLDKPARLDNDRTHTWGAAGKGHQSAAAASAV
jgi:hypothetical protein